MTTHRYRSPRHAGVTLVELVVSIVVISIGLAGILLVMNRNTTSSADPVVQHQAVAIAEAYLEEILAQNFCDPGSTCTPGPGNTPGSANCQVCTDPKEGGVRNLLNNVCDYDGVSDSPPVSLNQGGAPINSLTGYTANVQVSTNDSLNGLAGNQCQVLRVDVTVTGAGGVGYTLTGYRTNY
jgi:MSHA pilin protein MshD